MGTKTSGKSKTKTASKAVARKTAPAKPRKKAAVKSVAKSPKKPARPAPAPKTASGSSKKASVKKTAAPKTAKKKVATAPASSPKKSSAPVRRTPREKAFDDIRKKLVEQKSCLLCDAEEALNALPGETMFPDLGDQASAEIDRNFMLRLRGREQRLLKKIEEAIEKIETGAFGICETCGQEIDIKRLEARPVTNMCIYCKTEQEEEEKIRGI